MLVLSRKANEEIVIGSNVTVKVVRIEGNKVRLAISAPSSIRIRRGELPDPKEFEVLVDSLHAVKQILEFDETVCPR